MIIIDRLLKLVKGHLQLRIILFAFFLVLTSSLSASIEAFDKKELENLVEERWKTIINRKFGETYAYETPTYKAVFTEDLYVNQFSHGVDWSLTKIGDIKYDPATNVAVVHVLVETKPRDSKELDAKVKTASVEIQEKWLHIKGRWWHSSSE